MQDEHIAADAEQNSTMHACRYAARKGMGISSLAAAGDHVAAGAEGCVCFWDRRSSQELACFDDTHPEAITQVGHHSSTTPYQLPAGSTMWHAQNGAASTEQPF